MGLVTKARSTPVTQQDERASVVSFQGIEVRSYSEKGGGMGEGLIKMARAGDARWTRG